MTHTEIPSWAIDDAIERERQDEFLILIRSYGNARSECMNALRDHMNRHKGHEVDECPDYIPAWRRSISTFADIERHVRGC